MSEKTIRVCIDPGHNYSAKTGGDPGAVNGTHYEAVANLAIAKKVKKLLEAKGYKVKMTRTGGDKNLTLAERCRISNSFDADIFVSIHLNSATSKTANGIETLRYPKVGQRTKELAANVQTELVAALGWRDRGVKERADLYVLKHTVASAVLVECGFISNKEECKKLFNAAWQDKIAAAIAKGVQKTVE